MFVNKDTAALYNRIALPELSVESQGNLIDTYYIKSATTIHMQSDEINRNVIWNIYHCHACKNKWI
jgi:hypothetical protein